MTKNTKGESNCQQSYFRAKELLKQYMNWKQTWIACLDRLFKGAEEIPNHKP